MESSASQTVVDISAKPSSLKRRTKSEHHVTRSQSSIQQTAVRFQRKDADELIPSEAIHVTDFDHPVRIFQPSERPEVEATYDVTPFTIMTALTQRALLSANHIALVSKLKKSWQHITYHEYHTQVTTIAKAFIKLGLERCHGVGILGGNSPEWFIANLAAIFAGGISVALNLEYTAEACHNVAFDSRCNIIIVGSAAHCQRIFEVKTRLPNLKIVVQFPTADATRYAPEVQTWEELVLIGQECTDVNLEERILLQSPNLCCTLIYKPTPSGERRGVMLSHDNLLWTAAVVGQQLDLKYDRGHFVSFLPLSYTYSQIFEIYIPILYGSTVHFSATTGAAKGVLELVKEVRPSVFMAIPSLYDRMFEKLSTDFKNDRWMRRKLTDWATNIGKKTHKLYSNGHSRRPVCFYLANAIVFSRVRRHLGLDQTKMCLVTGAPISSKTFHFFVNLNIPILNVYGQAQTTGFETLSSPLRYRHKSVGQRLPGCSVDVLNKDEYGNGEIWVKGRNVFMGYLKDPVETMLAFDTHEWYNTGDRGKTEADLLFITDRVKDLLITQTGNKVAPKHIEDAVKSKLHCVSHCILVGEGQRYVSLLLTLKSELEDYTLEPSDRLAHPTLEWLRLLDCEGFTTVRDVRMDLNHKIVNAIQHVIDDVNKKAMTKSEHIEKWAILPKDFSVAGGELDLSSAMNRDFIVEKYSQFIELFYLLDDPSD